MSNSLLSSLAQNSGPKPQHKVQDIVWVDYSGTKFGPIPPWPGTVVSVAEGTVEVRFNDGSSDLFIVDRVMPFAGISCASYAMAANGEDFESEPAPRNDIFARNWRYIGAGWNHKHVEYQKWQTDLIDHTERFLAARVDEDVFKSAARIRGFDKKMKALEIFVFQHANKLPRAEQSMVTPGGATKKRKNSTDDAPTSTPEPEPVPEPEPEPEPEPLPEGPTKKKHLVKKLKQVPKKQKKEIPILTPPTQMEIDNPPVPAAAPAPAPTPAPAPAPASAPPLVPPQTPEINFAEYLKSTTFLGMVVSPSPSTPPKKPFTCVNCLFLNKDFSSPHCSCCNFPANTSSQPAVVISLLSDSEDDDNNLPPPQSKSKSKIKKEFTPVGFGEADQPPDVVEVRPPTQEAPPPPSPIKSNNIVDDDIVCVSTNATMIVDMPHPRNTCPKHPFIKGSYNDSYSGDINKMWTLAQTKSNEMFCKNCYCYVCCKPAADCEKWGNTPSNKSIASNAAPYTASVSEVGQSCHCNGTPECRIFKKGKDLATNPFGDVLRKSLGANVSDQNSTMPDELRDSVASLADIAEDVYNSFESFEIGHEIRPATYSFSGFSDPDAGPNKRNHKFDYVTQIVSGKLSTIKSKFNRTYNSKTQFISGMMGLTVLTKEFVKFNWKLPDFGDEDHLHIVASDVEQKHGDLVQSLESTWMAAFFNDSFDSEIALVAKSSLQELGSNNSSFPSSSSSSNIIDFAMLSDLAATGWGEETGDLKVLHKLKNPPKLDSNSTFTSNSTSTMSADISALTNCKAVQRESAKIKNLRCEYLLGAGHFSALYVYSAAINELEYLAFATSQRSVMLQHFSSVLDIDKSIQYLLKIKSFESTNIIISTLNNLTKQLQTDNTPGKSKSTAKNLTIQSLTKCFLNVYKHTTYKTLDASLFSSTIESALEVLNYITDPSKVGDVPETFSHRSSSSSTYTTLQRQHARLFAVAFLNADSVDVEELILPDQEVACADILACLLGTLVCTSKIVNTGCGNFGCQCGMDEEQGSLGKLSKTAKDLIRKKDYHSLSSVLYGIELSYSIGVERADKVLKSLVELVSSTPFISSSITLSDLPPSMTTRWQTVESSKNYTVFTLKKIINLYMKEEDLENTIKIFLVVLKKLIAGSDLNAATYMMDDIFEKLDVLFDPLTMPTYVDDVGTIMLSMFEACHTESGASSILSKLKNKMTGLGLWSNNWQLKASAMVDKCLPRMYDDVTKIDVLVSIGSLEKIGGLMSKLSNDEATLTKVISSLEATIKTMAFDPKFLDIVYIYALRAFKNTKATLRPSFDLAVAQSSFVNFELVGLMCAFLAPLMELDNGLSKKEKIKNVGVVEKFVDEAINNEKLSATLNNKNLECMRLVDVVGYAFGSSTSAKLGPYKGYADEQVLEAVNQILNCKVILGTYQKTDEDNLSKVYQLYENFFLRRHRGLVGNHKTNCATRMADMILQKSHGGSSVGYKLGNDGGKDELGIGMIVRLLALNQTNFVLSMEDHVPRKENFPSDDYENGYEKFKMAEFAYAIDVVIDVVGNLLTVKMNEMWGKKDAPLFKKFTPSYYLESEKFTNDKGKGMAGEKEILNLVGQGGVLERLVLDFTLPQLQCFNDTAGTLKDVERNRQLRPQKKIELVGEAFGLQERNPSFNLFLKFVCGCGESEASPNSTQPLVSPQPLLELYEDVFKGVPEPTLSRYTRSARSQAQIEFRLNFLCDKAVEILAPCCAGSNFTIVSPMIVLKEFAMATYKNFWHTGVLETVIGENPKVLISKSMIAAPNGSFFVAINELCEWATNSKWQNSRDCKILVKFLFLNVVGGCLFGGDGALQRSVRAAIKKPMFRETMKSAVVKLVLEHFPKLAPVSSEESTIIDMLNYIVAPNRQLYDALQANKNIAQAKMNSLDSFVKDLPLHATSIMIRLCNDGKCEEAGKAAEKIMRTECSANFFNELGVLMMGACKSSKEFVVTGVPVLKHFHKVLSAISSGNLGGRDVGGSQPRMGERCYLGGNYEFKNEKFENIHTLANTAVTETSDAIKNLREFLISILPLNPDLNDGGGLDSLKIRFLLHQNEEVYSSIFSMLNGVNNATAGAKTLREFNFWVVEIFNDYAYFGSPTLQLRKLEVLGMMAEKNEMFREDDKWKRRKGRGGSNDYCVVDLLSEFYSAVSSSFFCLDENRITYSSTFNPCRATNTEKTVVSDFRASLEISCEKYEVIAEELLHQLVVRQDRSGAILSREFVAALVKKIGTKHSKLGFCNAMSCWFEQPSYDAWKEVVGDNIEPALSVLSVSFFKWERMVNPEFGRLIGESEGDDYCIEDLDCKIDVEAAKREASTKCKKEWAEMISRGEEYEQQREEAQLTMILREMKSTMNSTYGGQTSYYQLCAIACVENQPDVLKKMFENLAKYTTVDSHSDSGFLTHFVKPVCAQIAELNILESAYLQKRISKIMPELRGKGMCQSIYSLNSDLLDSLVSGRTNFAKLFGAIYNADGVVMNSMAHCGKYLESNQCNAKVKKLAIAYLQKCWDAMEEKNLFMVELKNLLTPLKSRKKKVLVDIYMAGKDKWGDTFSQPFRQSLNMKGKAYE